MISAGKVRLRTPTVTDPTRPVLISELMIEIAQLVRDKKMAQSEAKKHNSALLMRASDKDIRLAEEAVERAKGGAAAEAPAQPLPRPVLITLLLREMAQLVKAKKLEKSEATIHNKALLMRGDNEDIRHAEQAIEQAKRAWVDAQARQAEGRIIQADNRAAASGAAETRIQSGFRSVNQAGGAAITRSAAPSPEQQGNHPPVCESKAASLPGTASTQFSTVRANNRVRGVAKPGKLIRYKGIVP